MGNQRDSGKRTRAPRTRSRVVEFVKPQFLVHEASALAAIVDAHVAAIDAGDLEAALADHAVLASVQAELGRARADAEAGRR